MADAVGDEVAHGHQRGDGGIGEAEFGQNLDGAGVPGKPALLDQECHRCGIEGLADRADVELRAGTDRRWPAQAPDPEAALVKRAAVAANGNRSTLHPPMRERALDGPVDGFAIDHVASPMLQAEAKRRRGNRLGSAGEATGRLER